MSKQQATVSQYVESNLRDLPPQVRAPTDRRHVPANESCEFGSINTINHVVKAAIDIDGLAAVEETVQAYGAFEREERTPNIKQFENELAVADDFVQNELQEHLEKMKESLDRREDWYAKLVRGEWAPSVEHFENRAAELERADTEFCLVLVTKPNSYAPVPPSIDHRITTADLDFNPETLGYDLPHAFLAVSNGSKPDSIYPQIPWYGTTKCSCPARQEMAAVPFCKHELWSAFASSKSPRKFRRHLPTHYRQIVNPNGRHLYNKVTE